MLVQRSSLIPCADRRHAMRGRLYYTARAKKTGKVMIRIHPCSRLCFCSCWTCFKEVTGRDVGGGRWGIIGSGIHPLPTPQVPRPHASHPRV